MEAVGLSAAGFFFVWLVVQTASHRRAGWISTVFLPTALALGSAYTLFPQVLSVLVGGAGSRWLGWLALLLSFVGGMYFDITSTYTVANGQGTGRRNPWPLLIWGLAATALTAGPALSRVPGLGAVVLALQGALGVAGVFSLLGQTTFWALRLRNPEPSPKAKTTASPATPANPDQVRRGSFWSGVIFSAIAVALLYGLPGGALPGGGSVSPQAVLISDGSLVKNNTLVSFDRSTSAHRKLPVQGHSARWSPDGKKMVFLRVEPASVWIAAADGSNARQLCRMDGFLSDPCWSADQRKIYFNYSPGLLGGTLQVIPVEGGSPRELLPNSEGVTYPALSPDGNSIAYFRGPDVSQVSQPANALKILDLATLQTRELYSRMRGWTVTGLQWTRDGRALILASIDNDSAQPQLERVEVANPTRQRLTPPMQYYLYSFSRVADSDRIALMAAPTLGRNQDPNRTTELWLVDPQTGQHETVDHRLPFRPHLAYASQVTSESKPPQRKK